MRKNHISALKILLSGALLVSTIEQSSSEYIWEYLTTSPVDAAIHAALHNAERWATDLYEAIRLKDVDAVQDMINKGADIRALCKCRLHDPSPNERREADYPEKICGGSYGVAPLHFAAALGDMQMFTLLRDNGADINERDCYNRTVLHYAIFSKNKDMIELLANDSAKVYWSDKEGRTPLDFAEEYFGDDEDVNNLLMDKSIEEFLLKEEEPVWRFASWAKFNLLYHALRLKRMELFEDLINKDPSRVNVRSGSGKTLWHLAVESRDKGLAEFLRNKNANASVNERDDTGYTPLYRALMNRDVEMVKLLLTVDNIDVNCICGYCSRPLLCYAAEHGYEEMVELLVGTGGKDFDARNIYGGAALYFAVKSGKLEIIKLLVGAGVKVSAREAGALLNIAGRHASYDKGYRDIVDFLTNQLPNIVPEPVRDTRNVFTKIADFFRNLRTNAAQSAD